MKIVVTGGLGGLGREVVAQLQARGADAVPASRRTGFDLRTGRGVASTLSDADVIVHAATHPVRFRKVDLDGTRRMVQVLADQQRRPHVVYVSIVGCDQNPYPYYRAKYACEIVLARSGLPVTVVRATQFHTLVAAVARAATRGGLALTVDGVAVQSCDPAWVAGQLADVAAGPAPTGYLRSSDLAGPERLGLGDAERVVSRFEGRRDPRLVTLPVLGRAAAAFAAGSNLPGPDARLGGPGFAEWLETQPRVGDQTRSS